MKNSDLPVYPDPMRAAEQSILNQTPDQLPTGLTKREYFIGQAIAGLSSIVDMTDENVVHYAFNIADLTIKKLEDEKKENQTT